MVTQNSPCLEHNVQKSVGEISVRFYRPTGLLDSTWGELQISVVKLSVQMSCSKLVI